MLNYTILQLGTFDDFPELQNLLLPLLIGLLTFFVMKPAYSFVKKKLNDDKSEDNYNVQCGNVEDCLNAENTQHETVHTTFV